MLVHSVHLSYYLLSIHNTFKIETDCDENPGNYGKLVYCVQNNWIMIKNMHDNDEFFPYKYKCSFSEISYDNAEAIHIMLNSWVHHVEDNRPLVLYYKKHTKKSTSLVPHIKPHNDKYFKMEISLCSKEEIMELKWDDMKDYMLLGYGVQNNSFKSLPDDLIKTIIICLKK